MIEHRDLPIVGIIARGRQDVGDLIARAGLELEIGAIEQAGIEEVDEDQFEHAGHRAAGVRAMGVDMFDGFGLAFGPADEHGRIAFGAGDEGFALGLTPAGAEAEFERA